MEIPTPKIVNNSFLNVGILTPTKNAHLILKEL